MLPLSRDAMDMVVLVAISRVSDGLEKLVVTLTGMRWMWLCCCHCRGYAKHMFAFSCQFVGMRWMGLFCCHYRGYAMDIVALVAILRASDGHGTFVITFVGLRWM